MSVVKLQIIKLAKEEIMRIYGQSKPDKKTLDEMIAVIEGWPMIQAVLNKAVS